MLMNEEDFEWRKTKLNDFFLLYSGKLNNCLTVGDDATDSIMKHIDVILDWYLDLVKEMNMNNRKLD